MDNFLDGDQGTRDYYLLDLTELYNMFPDLSKYNCYWSYTKCKRSEYEVVSFIVNFP